MSITIKYLIIIRKFNIFLRHLCDETSELTLQNVFFSVLLHFSLSSQTMKVHSSIVVKLKNDKEKIVKKFCLLLYYSTQKKSCTLFWVDTYEKEFISLVPTEWKKVQGQWPVPPPGFLGSTQCGEVFSSQNQIILGALFK